MHIAQKFVLYPPKYINSWHIDGYIGNIGVYLGIKQLSVWLRMFGLFFFSRFRFFFGENDKRSIYFHLFFVCAIHFIIIIIHGLTLDYAICMQFRSRKRLMPKKKFGSKRGCYEHFNTEILHKLYI